MRGETDPRAFTSMAANYATANRGGSHLEALSYWYGYGNNWPDLDLMLREYHQLRGPSEAKLKELGLA